MKLSRSFLSDFLVDRKRLVEALNKRPQSASEFLPYYRYLEKDQVYMMKDGSLGVVFEISLVEHEPMTSEQVVAQVRGLKSLFAVPENCTLQVLFEQNEVSPQDSLWDEFLSKESGGNQISSKLFQKRVDMLRKGSTLCGKPMRRRGFISLRFFPDFLKKGPSKTLLKTEERILIEENEEYKKELKEFKLFIEDYQNNAKVTLKRLGPNGLLGVLRRFFNPKQDSERRFCQFNPEIPLSQQVLYNSPSLSFGGVDREGFKTRTITLKTSPAVAFAGGISHFIHLGFPLRLSLNFSFPKKEKIKKHFDLKEFLLENTPTAKARRQKEDILGLQERLAHEDRILHMTFCVTVEAENEDLLERRCRDIISTFNHDLDCEVIKEDDIGLGLLINTLPLAYTPLVDASSQRAIKILRSHAVHFLPIFDSFRGHQKTLQLYMSRENNLCPISVLENEICNHSVILADTGSGKSSFVLSCIQSVKRLDPEPLVFIIDKKSSYKTLSAVYEADLTVFDPNKEMPFSPFRGHWDEAKIGFLTQLLLSAITLTSSSFQSEAEHLSAISKALKFAYKRAVEELGLMYQNDKFIISEEAEDLRISIDDVIREIGHLKTLKEFETAPHILDDLAIKLQPFYGDGIYACYFNNYSKNKGISSKFYVYDLDALDSDPTLKSLMTMCVFEEIRQIIAQPENRSCGGVIIFEEVGRLGANNKMAANYIVDFAETIRKFGFALIPIAPNPKNFFKTEAGAALWAAAEHRYILRMSSDNIRYLREQSEDFDEANAEIIRSLETKKDQYAEIFYMNKDKSVQGAFRYVQTPYDKWLASTSNKAQSKADKVIKKFCDDPWLGLEHLVASDSGKREG